jgi:hypothetical protein
MAEATAGRPVAELAATQDSALTSLLAILRAATSETPQ